MIQKIIAEYVLEVEENRKREIVEEESGVDLNLFIANLIISLSVDEIKN